MRKCVEEHCGKGSKGSERSDLYMKVSTHIQHTLPVTMDHVSAWYDG